MGVTVFVNGRSIVAKAAAGMSIAAFPDVCLSPPPPPIGPIPIPYPNTALAMDLTLGSVTVKAHCTEIAKKNLSFFMKSTGDEAATPALGMGVVSHKIIGMMYFVSWSMDVKVEGMNVPRHLDLTTHNHAALMPGNTPVWPYFDTMMMLPGGSGSSGSNITPAPTATNTNDASKTIEMREKLAQSGHTMAIEAAHGFSESDVFAVGSGGEIYRYDGTNVKKLDSPTNVALWDIRCVAPNLVFAGGASGVLLRGQGDDFESIEHECTDETIVSLEWFAERLYVASMQRVYRLEYDALVPVDIGFGRNATAGHLYAKDGALWSRGGNHLSRTTDGRTWTPIAARH